MPSEIVNPDLSPIATFMFDSMISARTDRWLKKRLEEKEQKPASVAEQVRREQAEWQKLRLVS